MNADACPTTAAVTVDCEFLCNLKPHVLSVQFVRHDTAGYTARAAWLDGRPLADIPTGRFAQHSFGALIGFVIAVARTITDQPVGGGE